MLTKKQQLLLAFIHQRLQEEGVPPSFDEMKEALDLKSKSGIHRLITALEERGFIRRLPNRARALEVIKMPEAWGDAVPENATPAFANVPRSTLDSNTIDANIGGSVITADFGNKRNLGKSGDNVTPFPGAHNTPEEESYGFSVPVMGKIAAGVPIAAIQDNTHSVTVPPEMIGNGEYFALTVEGDSMINAGIHDGDTVVIRQASTATGGEIVVALVDDEEATLKTFFKSGSEISLEAANPAYETRVLRADRVKVQGKLVGLIRQYH